MSEGSVEQEEILGLEFEGMLTLSFRACPVGRRAQVQSCSPCICWTSLVARLLEKCWLWCRDASEKHFSGGKHGRSCAAGQGMGGEAWKNEKCEAKNRLGLARKIAKL